jgi:DNA-directed RNA polymerase beta subunit
MKTIKAGILTLSIAALLASCDSKEKAKLQYKVDSLNTELQASQAEASQLKEVNTLIDSIDASRRVLRANVVEGTSYANYSERLNDINQYIKDSQAKIAELEKKSKNAAGMSSSIKRLKADLELRQSEIAALQLEVSKMRSENELMVKAINSKDSTLLAREEVIRVREADISSLETLMKDTNEQNKITTANLYFEQAKAMEKVADRTNFAPRKKKEALREALELYKISLSLGKQEAQQKITALEKQLS